MVLFSWFGAEVIDKGRELKLKEPIKIYQVYCGKYLGILNGLVHCFYLEH